MIKVITRLPATDITCGCCQTSIESTLKALSYTSTVSIHLANRTVIGSTTPTARFKTLKKVNFTASVVGT